MPRPPTRMACANDWSAQTPSMQSSRSPVLKWHTSPRLSGMLLPKCGAHDGLRLRIPHAPAALAPCETHSFERLSPSVHPESRNRREGGATREAEEGAPKTPVETANTTNGIRPALQGALKGGLCSTRRTSCNIWNTPPEVGARSRPESLLGMGAQGSDVVEVSCSDSGAELTDQGPSGVGFLAKFWETLSAPRLWIVPSQLSF